MPPIKQIRSPDCDNLKSTAVNAYTAAGFTLFPCIGKTPAVKHWQSVNFDPCLTAEDLPDTYGVILTDDYVVLDVDPRRFAPGENQIADLWQQLNLAPLNTYVVATPSGGAHIYFTKPRDIYVRSRVPGYPAIDVKTKGGYVLGAGSVTEGAYTPDRLSPERIAPIPGALLTHITRTLSPVDTIAGKISDDVGAVTKYITYLASVPGAIEKRGGDAQTYTVACEGKAYGLSSNKVFELIKKHYNPKCQPPWTDIDLSAKVKNAFNYAQTPGGALSPLTDFADVKLKSEPDDVKIKFDLEKDGTTLKPTIQNICSIFRLPNTPAWTNPLHNLLRYNLFSDQIEFTRPAPWHTIYDDTLCWKDSDCYALKEFLGRHRPLYPATSTVFEAAVILAKQNQYHPVRDWLATLKWDGVTRLDTWLITYCGAADTPYVREVGKNTLIAAVARVMKPGTQHDYMLVLEGAQGTGKSSVVRTLGGEWYADIVIDPHAKDTIQSMMGAWILEASEMEFTRRAEVNALKAFISRTTDKIRLSYARTASVIPRQQIFIGTINPTQHGYLTDPTGNRRFWAVGTSRIDLQALKRDRVQLFAEALARYEIGEAHHIIDLHLAKQAIEEQAKRLQKDYWEHIIGGYLDRARDAKPEYLTTEYLCYNILNISYANLGQIEQRRLTNAMRGLGYSLTKVWNKKTKVRDWVWLQTDLLSDI